MPAWADRSAPTTNSWSPQEPRPAGVRLENRRKLGSDDVLIECSPPARLHILAGLATAGACLLCVYAIFMTPIAAVSALLTAALTVALAAFYMPPYVAIAIRPGMLSISTRQWWGGTDRSHHIEFTSIEAVSIRSRGPGRHDEVEIATSGAKIYIGQGMSAAALTWLKNYLVLELTGLTWRPVVGGGRRPVSDLSSDQRPNPVLLKPDLAMRLIAIFKEQAPIFVRELRLAVDANDAVEVRRHAHWLKSASANVGARHLSEMCQLVELSAIDGDLSPCSVLMREIEKTLPAVISWLMDVGSNASLALTQSGRRTGAEAVTDTRPRYDVRVLVVDDSAVSREIAAEFLSDLVTRVEFAVDGVQAVQMWRERCYDLIFMDCEMINMNGFDATRQIRLEEGQQSLARIPIIALTGNILLDHRDQCLAAGMDDYIAKPYPPERLKEAITIWIGQKIAMEALSQEDLVGGSRTLPHRERTAHID